MSEKSVAQIRKNMEEKSLEELLRIWQENDREQWSEKAFEAIKQLLLERGETLPDQKKVLNENQVQEIKEEAQTPEKTVADMKKDLRSWGFGLIAIGVISIVLKFLDPVWGGVLIVIGVLTLLIQRRTMFITIGICLLLAGIMNIGSGSGEFGGWTIFGILQIYWGIQEIRKFWKYGPTAAKMAEGKLRMQPEKPVNEITIHAARKPFLRFDEKWNIRLSHDTLELSYPKKGQKFQIHRQQAPSIVKFSGQWSSFHNTVFDVGSKKLKLFLKNDDLDLLESWIAKQRGQT